MCLANKNADKILVFSLKFWGVFCYHKGGISLPFINAEEQKRKTKESFILQIWSSKVQCKER